MFLLQFMYGVWACVSVFALSAAISVPRGCVRARLRRACFVLCGCVRASRIRVRSLIIFFVFI